MGKIITKLDRKNLSKLYISLNELADQLQHEFSLVISQAMAESIERGEFHTYSSINHEWGTYTHSIVNQQQGALHNLFFYKGTRGAKDLLKGFDDYTGAIRNMGNYILDHTHKSNFERVTNLYTELLGMQRDGRDYFKVLIHAEKEEKAAAKKEKDSIIPLNLTKSA